MIKVKTANSTYEIENVSDISRPDPRYTRIRIVVGKPTGRFGTLGEWKECSATLFYDGLVVLWSDGKSPNATVTSKIVSVTCTKCDTSEPGRFTHKKGCTE